jgi:hypothetical protein
MIEVVQAIRCEKQGGDNGDFPAGIWLEAHSPIGIAT